MTEIDLDQLDAIIEMYRFLNRDDAAALVAEVRRLRAELNEAQSIAAKILARRLNVVLSPSSPTPGQDSESPTPYTRIP